MNNQLLKYVLFILIVSVLTGCNTLSGNIKETKNEIIGTNIDTLFSKWGVPTMSVPMKSTKGAVYTWDRGGCNNNVTANKEGVITNYTATGSCDYIQW